MNKKKNLLNLFAQDTVYNFHIIKTEEPDGHLLYLIKNGEPLEQDSLEFSPNLIIEGLIKECSVVAEKFAPSIFFTEETSTEKLKYLLTEKLTEDLDFSNFIESIKDEYRILEVKDSLLYKKDPDAYEANKRKEHEEHQKDLWEEAMNQMLDKKKSRENTILAYENNIIKLFKDYFEGIIEYEKRDFDFSSELSKIIGNLIDPETWIKINDVPFVCRIDICSLENDKINAFLTDNNDYSYTATLKFDKTVLVTENIIRINKGDEMPKIKSDYEILSQLYDIDTQSVEEWEYKNETDRIEYVIDYLVPIFKVKKEANEKELMEKYLKDHPILEDDEDTEEFNLDDAMGNFNNNNKSNIAFKQPNEYVFNVLVPDDMDELNPSVIAFMEKDFWEKNHYFDDQMGAHRLPQNIIDSLNNAGIEGDSELMESVWAVADCEGKSEQDIINSMIAEGFIYVPDMS